MTLHLHTEPQPWCFRCRLSAEEAADMPDCTDGCEDFACYGECNDEDEEPDDE